MAESEASELEIGLSETGGTLRLKLRRGELVERSDEVVRSSLGDFDEISLFSSNVSERIVFNLNPRQDWSPEFIHLFAARGRDRIKVSQKVPSEDYVLAIHGQKGDDRLDASRFSGEVELDGGAGRDVLIGGRARSELWGGSGADTFDLRSELSGLQMIMDFDPDVDQLRLDPTVASYRIDVRGDDLWLLTGERAVAVFEGLADQHDTLEDLIG